jgi:outer membrane protein OmpA-like peptidoglycan-associated protein
LITSPLEAERIRHRGMGKEQAIASNATLIGRLANQRIEITFSIE